MRLASAIGLLLLLLVGPAVPASQDKEAGQDILDRYFAAVQSQAAQMRGVQMDVDIDAKIPKLQKEGRMHALRLISRLGRIAYRPIRFMGDNTIKKDVIGRYLTAEVQPQTMDIGINEKNYKFKYKGSAPRDGREVHIFALSPRKKAVGLFKGELWIDPDTFLPVRESGTLVKNPSVFLKKVEFVRQYEIRDGLAIPKHIQSTVDTRIVGKAELAIDFSNFTKQPPDQEESTEGESGSETAQSR